jgi:signal transduction histidine kinase
LKERLYQVSREIHSTLDSQEALKLIVGEAVRIMKANSGSVALVNPTTGYLEILASSGLSEEGMAKQLRVGEGVTGWVASTGQLARVADVSKDSRYVTARGSARSELAVPLAVNDEVRGVLNVDSDRKAAFSESDEQLLTELATQAARVIQNTWLYEQLRLKARLFETLSRVSRTINSTLNLDDALRVITRETCSLMRAKMCSLFLLDDEQEWLELRASYGAGKVYLSKPPLPVAESLLGVVVRRKRALQVENVQTSGQYQNVEVAKEEGIVSLLSVPLTFTDHAIGTLNVYTEHPYSFSNEEIRILSSLAELSAIAIEKARLYERIVDVEEQLRQNEKLSALGLLAAEVAHEIRNPLTVMKMLYHSLDLSFDAEDPRAHDARLIGEKMELLNRIVEQILDLARTSEPALTQVDLNLLMDELAMLVRHKLRNQQIKLRRQLDPELPLIMADATQLEQAFLNLVLNAAESMPSGGVLTIRTRKPEQGEGAGSPALATVEFEDTGHGMSEDQVKSAFRSLLKSSKDRGTGLGLAIVRRIVEAHRGKVGIESRLGEGTRISMKLPV